MIRNPPKKNDFMAAAHTSIKSRPIKTLSDGSQLVGIRPARRIGEPTPEAVIVREIRAELDVPGAKRVAVRLWTTLLDEKAYPAIALVRLYVQR